MVEPGSRPEEASGLRIDAVEALPTDLRSVLLRVAGAWEGPRPPELRAPVLVLREEGREHRIEALPETSDAAARAAPEPQAFRAAFSVADALAPLLAAEAALDLGPVTVRLPPPTALGEEAEAGDVEGTVVDRAVLAEHRARRAELAEEANAQRAGEAEQSAAKLEGELGKLELRLAAATRERAGLEARLADREREARVARQSELEVLRREVALAAAVRAARVAAPPAAKPGPVLAAALERERRLLAAPPWPGDPARRQAEDQQRARALELAERAIAEARTIVAEAQAEVEGERSGREAAEAELLARFARERAELEARLTTLERHARDLSDRVEAELSARRAVEAELEAAGDLVDVERARFVGKLAAIEGTVAELTQALNRVGAGHAADLETERERTRAAEARAGRSAERLAAADRKLAQRVRRRPTSEPEGPWLEDALRRLARMDAAAGAQLALALLPGQALAVEGAVDYDVAVAGLGWHRVTVSPGTGELADLASRRRRWRADFRVVATPAGIVRLAVDGGAARPVGVRVAGTLRRRRALRRLPAVPLRPAALARAGVLVDPGLLYRGLAAGIDPEWSRGHRFTVALEISGPRGGTWHVIADDGARVAVGAGLPEVDADAVVRASHVAFQHLLDGESPPSGEKAAIRGDATAIGLLARWTDLARRRERRARNVRN